MRSDVPVGLFPSGGVDLASVLALMRPQAESIETFTAGYDAKTPDNELIHARKVAAHFHTTHHERVINAEDWWNGFQRYVYHHDDPNANPLRCVADAAGRGDGQARQSGADRLGGDETAWRCWRTPPSRRFCARRTRGGACCAASPNRCCAWNATTRR
ncbi:MAG: hypothetical protein IPK17_39485 [Chloroflexi bacterium]|uniref:asparagine synthase-related protein n=1 Tax=Candidatus Flexifilum breve TaxID=3140694 RepID=UPI0031370DAE|nr:hypothetical protein [Chloroflexota bacterium]